MRVLACQRVPVAPGNELGTDVYLPDGPGRFPAVLTRTPYNRNAYQATGKRLADRGYAFVCQDCRGRNDSGGTFRPVVDEGNDGHKTIDWIANQKWCNGRVALSGISYPGMVQVPAAAQQHEALRAIAPAAPPGHPFSDWPRCGGCFLWANTVRWLLNYATCQTMPPAAHFKWSEIYRMSDLNAIQERVGFMPATMRQWVERDTYDDFWASVDPDLMLPRITVPGLHIGGWNDHVSRQVFASYRGISFRGATEAARRGQRMLIGPWGHMTIYAEPKQRQYGAWDFGPDSVFQVWAYEDRFMDFHLKDIDNGFTALPRVKLFVMGDNRWADFTDWPPPEVRMEPWHLGPNGSLGSELPGADRADTFTYDPANPVPTRGGPIFWGCEEDEILAAIGAGVVGPVDLRPILNRPDILVYRSAPLPRKLTVIGDIALELTVSSSAEDTDMIARFCVEESGGAIMPLTVGSLRLRYRESWSQPKALVPGGPTRVRLDLGQIAYAFAPGSRICLTITSSDYPRILPNPNTMAPTASASPGIVAQNTVHHGPSAASRLLLPIVET